MWLWRWRWVWLMWLRRVGLRSLCLLRWWSAILRPLCHLLRTLCFGLLGLQLLVLLVHARLQLSLCRLHLQLLDHFGS